MRSQKIALAFAALFIWGCGGSSGNVPLVTNVSFTGNDTYDGLRTPLTVTTEAFAAPSGGTDFIIGLGVTEREPVEVGRGVNISFESINPEPGSYEFSDSPSRPALRARYRESYLEVDKEWKAVAGSMTVISNDGNVFSARLNNVSFIPNGSSNGTVILDGPVEVPIRSE